MELIRTNTEKRQRFGRWFARKAITYVVICSFLSFVNWYTTPHSWWVLWVIVGWGIGIVLSLAFYLTGCDDDRNYTTKN